MYSSEATMPTAAMPRDASGPAQLRSLYPRHGRDARARGRAFMPRSHEPGRTREVSPAASSDMTPAAERAAAAGGAAGIVRRAATCAGQAHHDHGRRVSAERLFAAASPRRFRHGLCAVGRDPLAAAGPAADDRTGRARASSSRRAPAHLLAENMSATEPARILAGLRRRRGRDAHDLSLTIFRKICKGARIMTTRLNAKAIAPDAYNALRGLQNYIDACGIEKPLIELIKVRASQINRLRLLHRHAHGRCREGRRKPGAAAPVERLARDRSLHARASAPRSP